MNKFEDKLKYISKQDIEISQNYEKSVNEALRYVSTLKNKKNKRNMNKIFDFIKKIAVAIAITASSLTVYAGITGNLNFENLNLNKLSKNFEENKVSITQSIENEYLKLSLENIARDSAYIILEYKLELNENGLSKIGNITFDRVMGYSFGLNSKITLNDEAKTMVIDYINKETDREYSYYQIINTTTFDSEEQNIKIWINSLWTRTNYDEDIPINKMIEISTKIDNVNDDFVKVEKKLEDGSKLTLEKIVNTNFQTFIKFNRVLDDVKIKEYDNRIFENYKLFVVTDKEDNLIPHTMYSNETIGQTRFYDKELGKYVEQNQLNKNSKIRIEEDYVILLDEIVDDIKDIKIYPLKTRLYNSREEQENYKKAIWYSVVEGDKKYTAKSNLGGTLEINKIEINDEDIIFHYNKIGNVENNVSYVLLRQNNGKMNYVYPIKQDIQNSGKVIFPKDLGGVAGLNVNTINIDNLMTNLEFTLLFGNITEYEGNVFESNIPEQKNQKIEITKINQEDTYTHRIKYKSGNGEVEFKINYDINDNILSCSGGEWDRLLYMKDGDIHSIDYRKYNKVNDLINEIKECLEYRNINYTIE